MNHFNAFADLDARAQRATSQLFIAFSELVLSERYDEISVADIVARAGVARSTFYQHFANKDELLTLSMGPMLETLANAAAGQGDMEQVQFVLDHFWENRSLARVILRGTPYELIVKALAQRIGEQLQRQAGGAQVPATLDALGRASSQFAQIRAWLLGQAGCASADLARHLCNEEGSIR